MTLFAFLALFPLALLSVAAFGYVLHSSVEAHEQVKLQLDGLLPGIGDKVAAASVSGRFSNTVLGVLGAVTAGLGWIGAARKGLSVVSGRPSPCGRIRSTLADLAHGAEVAAMMGISVAATIASLEATHWVGAVAHGPAAALIGAWVSEAAAFVSGLVLFTALLRRVVPDARPAKLLEVSAVAAVAFELVKTVMARYLDLVGAYQASVYGAFAGVVGLLAWINVMSRLLLIAGSALGLATPVRERRRATTGRRARVRQQLRLSQGHRGSCRCRTLDGADATPAEESPSRRG